MISSTRKPLQSPKPPPFVVNKNSLKIKKPSSPPNGQIGRGKGEERGRSPVIIYLKSPDIIHVRPEEFMNLVQRLTGKKEEQNNNGNGTVSTSQSSSCCTTSSSSAVVIVDHDDDDTRKKGDSVEQELDSTRNEVDQYNSFCASIYPPQEDDWSEF